jgi:hypothetical protein
VFISSPGDVSSAREVVAQTVEQVAVEYRRFFTVEPFLWENEAMLASGHFQDSIEPPSQFDIVILLLGSRLGTPLPERTALRDYRGIDGRAPVTGTEWEFEEALAAARTRGAPHLLVYRSRQDVRISSVDLAAQQAQLAQLEALNAFWARHFEDKGEFIGASARFDNLEQLSASVEKNLGALLKRRVADQRSGAAAEARPVWTGDPFRGLESYEFEHAPIYFGRGRMVSKAMLQLLAQIERGTAFLLVVGASGSGKSSLVKAGLAPRLFEPRRVPSACLLRRVVFRPGEAGDDGDVFAALAQRLTAADAADVGLAELVAGTDAAGLAEHLRHAHASPGFAFARALGEVGAAARRTGRMLDYQQPKLLLVVDQLEELFTLERIGPDDRRRFVGLLAGLARSGHAIVVATLRSDLWSLAAQSPELVALAEGDGRLDLAPASPAEIGQMIRLPVAAAGLSFETDHDSGIGLGEHIAEAAAREADALPLLSSLLEALYLDTGAAGRLGYDAYERLGGLTGAIAARADAVLAAQGGEGRSALAALLFALVQMDDEGRPSARPSSLAKFALGGPERRLVEALAEARLVVLDTGADGQPTARLAHEALLTHWDAARDTLAAQALALKARRMAEARLRRAGELGGGARGLLTAVDLADVRDLVGRYRGQLSPELTAFIDRSAAAEQARRRASLLRWGAAAAALFALAAGAAYAVRWAMIQSLDRELLRTYDNAHTAYSQGNYARAASDFRANQARARQLMGMDGGDPNWPYNLALSDAEEAMTLEKAGDMAAAKAPYAAAQAAIADLRARFGDPPAVRDDLKALEAGLSAHPPQATNGAPTHS